jgi:hypothetical protein
MTIAELHQAHKNRLAPTTINHEQQAQGLRKADQAKAA